MKDIYCIIKSLEKNIEQDNIINLEIDNLELLKKENISQNEFDSIIDNFKKIITSGEYCVSDKIINEFLHSFLFNSKHKNFYYEYVYLYILIVLSCCFKKPTILNFSDYTKKSYEMYKRVNNANIFCRGVSNSNYDLIPSMYRDLIKNKINIIVDDDYIDELYRAKRLTNMYKDLISKEPIGKAFYSFMQHSISYSPLLDITKSLEIALSFATYNQSSVNNYENIDAAIYMFEDVESTNRQGRKIQIIPNKIKVTDSIFDKKIYLCDLEDFKMEYEIISEMTNDRMKYQQGQFVNIMKAVIINNRICIPNNKNITKYIIKSKEIKDYYSYICKNHDRYRFEYLMDPYLYFKNIT